MVGKLVSCPGTGGARCSEGRAQEEDPCSAHKHNCKRPPLQYKASKDLHTKTPSPSPSPPTHLHTYTHPMSPSLRRLVSLSGCPCWGWHSTNLCCWTQVMMTLTSSRISLLRSSETSTSLKRVRQGYGCICMMWCAMVVGETS